MQLAEVASRGLAVDKACEERQKVVVQLVLDCQVGREGGREGGRERRHKILTGSLWSLVVVLDQCY